MAKDEKAKEGYRVEYVELSEVVRWPRNPKKHDEAGIDESLERFGFTEPLVLDENSGKLVAGHGRLEALQRRKGSKKEPPKNIATKGDTWLVPVVRGIRFKDEAEAEAYLVASNRLVEVGGWDEEGLSAILNDLRESGSLLGTGYQSSDVDAMVREVQAAGAPVMGMTPAEAHVGFLAAEIKQIVMYFEAPQYDTVVVQLANLQQRFGVASNTEVLLNLLQMAKADEPSPAPAS